MSRPKFRIADLVVLIVFAGLVAFAVREELLILVAPVVFFGAVCVATIGRNYRAGPGRAAWSTFALFGWGFLGFLALFVIFDGGTIDDWELIDFSVSGLLGASFSAYVAGRLVPREETGTSGEEEGAGTVD